MCKQTGTRMPISGRQSTAKWLVASIGLFMLITAGTGTCFGEQQGAKDVLAKWGNKVITKKDVAVKLSTLPLEYQMRFQTEDQLQEFLEGMVQMQILGAEAKAQKLDKDKAVSLKIADAINSILVQEYVKKKIADIKKATDKDIEAYYQAHKAEYLNPAQVKAQHILIRVENEAKPEEIAAAKTKADGIRKELLAGGDFSKLAEKYSDDPGSKAQGGDLGFFTKDKMIPEFSQVAFSMKKNEISEPIKTGYGFHIIKLNESTPEKQMDLQEATPLIQAKIENSKREAVIEKDLERLKKKYNVKIMNTPGPKK